MSTHTDDPSGRRSARAAPQGRESPGLLLEAPEQATASSETHSPGARRTLMTVGQRLQAMGMIEGVDPSELDTFPRDSRYSGVLQSYTDILTTAQRRSVISHLYTNGRHWLSSLPIGARLSIYEFIHAHDDWFQGELLQLCDAAICDGDPNTCTDHTAEDAANLYMDCLGPAQSFMIRLEQPLRDTQEMQAGRFLRQPAETFSERDLILADVATVEHRVHRYGFRMSAKEGRTMAQSRVAKFLLMLHIAAQVPLASAHWPYSDWDSTQWRFKENTYHTRWLFFVDQTQLFGQCMAQQEVPYVNVLAMRNCSSWAASEYFNKSLQCYHRVHLVTADELSQRCDFSELSGPQCVDVRAQLHMNWRHAATRQGVYSVPQLVCEYAPSAPSLALQSFEVARDVCLLVPCILLWMWSMRWIIRLLFHILSQANTAMRRVFSLCGCLASAISHIFSLVLFNRHKSLLKVSEVTVDVAAKLEENIATLYKLVGSGTINIDSLEMSLKGSEIRTSGIVNGCVYLASVHDGEPTFVGMAFRFGNYLVTAQHNLVCMNSLPGKHYMLPFAPTKADVLELDMNSMLELTPDMISADIVGEEFSGYDVSILPIVPSAWSRLKVKTLSHADARWGANVTVYGLEKAGQHKLQRSIGQIVRAETAPIHQVLYTASTLKGWSGSPVLTGHGRVAALHCGTNGSTNRGINIAYIMLFIDLHEACTQEVTPDAKTQQILKSFRGRGGRQAIRSEELEYERMEDAGIDRYKLMMCQGASGQVWASAQAEVDQAMRYHTHEEPYRNTEYYDDDDDGYECAIDPPQTNMQKQPPPQCIVPPEPSSLPMPKRLLSPTSTVVFDFEEPSPFRVTTTGPRLSAPHFRGRPSEHDKHVDMDEAVALGYDPTVFGTPRAIDRRSAIERSKRSLKQSLEKAADVRKNFKVPTPRMSLAAKKICLDLLKPLRYVADCSGITKEKILSQIHSSAVGCSRSPGLPFTAEGFTSNADLFEKRGIEEVAETAVNRYRNGTWQQPSVNFLKCDEPTKVSKLDLVQDRCVQAVGLEAQFYFRCLFGALGDTATKNYRNCPIMCGWSPLKPGDGQYLYDTLNKKGKEIVYGDGETWEFVGHTEHAYSVANDIFVGLGVADADTSPEDIRAWRREARDFLEEMGKSGYALADGTLIEKTCSFILNSGRWDTFLRNSITMLYWLVIGLLEVGIQADVIRKMFIKVGGDDFDFVRPDNFCLKTFVSKLSEYGIIIHKAGTTTAKEGFEFFSWFFSKNELGDVQWVPSRFSKHLEKFFNTKHEIRGEALVSHMHNYAHSEPHFEFFRKIYMRGRKEQPELYALEELPNREDLLMHFSGLESMISNDDSLAMCLASFPTFCHSCLGDCSALSALA